MRARRVARGEFVTRPDLMVGFDLDGFLLGPAASGVAAIKGVLADEARFERGLARGQTDARGAPREAPRPAARPDPRDERVLRLSHRASYRRAGGGSPSSPSRSTWHAGARPSTPRRSCPRRDLDPLRRAPLPEKGRRDPARRDAAAFRRAVLRIVGTGPDLARLEHLSRDLGVGALVQFLGHVAFARLAGEYRRADVFCLPSRQEAFGIVFLEAMAAGLSIVAARAAAVPEVVPDGDCGILVRPDARTIWPPRSTACFPIPRSGVGWGKRPPSRGGL